MSLISSNYSYVGAHKAQVSCQCTVVFSGELWYPKPVAVSRVVQRVVNMIVADMVVGVAVTVAQTVVTRGHDLIA